MPFWVWLGSVEEGLVYGLTALGMYITFRILSMPDLTVDGTFPLGAAVAATLITGGASPCDGDRGGPRRGLLRRVDHGLSPHEAPDHRPFRRHLNDVALCTR